MTRRLAGVLSVVAMFAANGCGGDDGTSDLDGGLPRDGGVLRDADGIDSGPGIDAFMPADDGGVMDAPVATDAGPRRDGGIALACTSEEILPIVECAADNCVMLPEGGLLDASLPDPSALVACILRNCALLVLGVSSGCRECIIAGVGMNLDEIRMSCVSGLPML